MKFDIIILSYNISKKHRKITEDCIKTIQDSVIHIGAEILVIESGEMFDYGVKTIKYPYGKFCYNKAMNYGINETKNKYILLCNNDLVFGKGCLDKLYNGFHAGYKSLSPYCNITHPRFVDSGNYLIEGYTVGYHVAGWCLAVDRDLFKTIGKLNEGVDFWYSDNIYKEQLIYHKIKHALVCNAHIDHINIGSQTLNTLSPKERSNLTSKQKKKYHSSIIKIYKDAKG